MPSLRGRVSSSQGLHTPKGTQQGAGKIKRERPKSKAKAGARVATIDTATGSASQSSALTWARSESAECPGDSGETSRTATIAVLEVADQLPTVMASKRSTEEREPLLDTGASHLLMNLDHLTEEQAAEAKRIHVNQATGAPKRALLLNGVIYAADVGRVLVSVGALKERLRLHFEWTGVDPMLILEDAQGRWELFRGSVDGRLPVLTQGQFKVLFRAYQDSFLGVVWDRQRWVDELGGKDLTKAVVHVTVTLGATQVKTFEDAAAQVLGHCIPTSVSRTNLKDGEQTRPVKSQMFGAAVSRGRGITSPTWKFPVLVSAVHLLAACRAVQDPYTTFQVTETPLEGLPLHHDRHNKGLSWVCSFGDYVGGDLWVEHRGAYEPGLVPPPGAVTAQQKKLRGKLVSTRHTWVHFDAHVQHAVTPVTSGRRVSVALYVLKGWETLGPDLLEDLGELGFPLPEQTATSLNPAVATVELKPAEVQTLPGDDLTDLTYDDDAADTLEEHLRSDG